MRRIRKEDEKKQKNDRLTYLPMSFENSMSFLSYCITRDDILSMIINDSGVSQLSCNILSFNKL